MKNNATPLILKPHILICFAAVCLWLCGCGPRSAVSKTSLPHDSFRLTVSDLFTDDDERVSTFNVETQDRPRISVTSGRNSYGNWPAEVQSSQGRSYQETVLWL